MRWRLCVLGLLVASSWACGADDPATPTPRPRVTPSPSATPTPTPTPAGLPPIADAGDDRAALIGDTVTLDGSRSRDPDSSFTSSWRLVESPRAGLTFAADGPTATFVPTWDGRFVFELTVSDGARAATDRVAIDVSCQAAQVVSGWSDGRARWVERNPPPSCLDYRVDADTVVPAGQNLVVDPGVRVAVAPGVALGAHGGGFVAVGTAEAPIVFGGVDGGAWVGITVSESPNVQLIHAVVEGGDAAALSVQGASIALIEHSTLRGAAGYGLVVGLFALIENFYDNDVTGNALGAAEIELNQVAKLGRDSRFTGNGVERVRVRGSALNTPSTWDALGVPYVVGEPGESVRIERDFYWLPGVVVEVEPGVGLEVALPGITFTMAGEVDRPIRLGSASGAAGSWRGLAVGSGARADLRHSLIEGGGGGAPWSASQPMGERANVAVLASAPRTEVALRSVALMHSGGVGLWIEPADGVAVTCEQVTAEQAVMPACPYAR